MSTDHRETAALFGCRVRHLRQQLGLTQEELARRTGFTKSYIQRLEAGHGQGRPVNPDLRGLCVLAAALGVESFALLMPMSDSSERTPPVQGEDEEGEVLDDEAVPVQRLRELLRGGAVRRSEVVRGVAPGFIPGMGWRRMLAEGVAPPVAKSGQSAVIAQGQRLLAEELIDRALREGRLVVDEAGSISLSHD